MEPNRCVIIHTDGTLCSSLTDHLQDDYKQLLELSIPIEGIDNARMMFMDNEQFNRHATHIAYHLGGYKKPIFGAAMLFRKSTNPLERWMDHNHWNDILGPKLRDRVHENRKVACIYPGLAIFDTKILQLDRSLETVALHAMDPLRILYLLHDPNAIGYNDMATKLCKCLAYNDVKINGIAYLIDEYDRITSATCNIIMEYIHETP
jgi:hypothetical protein